jgi:hypothetical protein
MEVIARESNNIYKKIVGSRLKVVTYWWEK